MKIASGVLRREGLRVFRRLRESGHFLQRIDQEGETIGLFSPRNHWQKPVMKTDTNIVEALHRADLLAVRPQPVNECAPCGAGPVYILSDAGHAWWRRASASADPCQAQHQLNGEAVIEEPGRGMVRRDVNLGESPLGWLRRRQGKNKAPYLTEAEADAGEQLRRDYTHARLDARTTLNWDGMLAHVDRSPTSTPGPENVSAHALDARKRVERALAEVGPGLSDIVLETCCRLHGLEQSERTLGWPQRSGKLVLKIALGRLAEHYKLAGGPDARHGTYVWKADGTKPPKCG